MVAHCATAARSNSHHAIGKPTAADVVIREQGTLIGFTDTDSWLMIAHRQRASAKSSEPPAKRAA